MVKTFFSSSTHVKAKQCCRSNETNREDFDVIAWSSCRLDRLVADINNSRELHLAGELLLTIFFVTFGNGSWLKFPIFQ